MEEDDQPLAAPLGGHERRAVREARPCLLHEARLRLGQHLPLHAHVLGGGQAVEGARRLELRKRLGRLPGHGAAEHAAVAPQMHGEQIVGGVGEARTGEAQKRPALLHEAGERVIGIARREAHIGQRHRIGPLGEKRQDRIDRAGPRLAQLRKRRERLVEIIDR
ncbi:hypothetical protein WOB59_10365 [Methylocystis sp. IM4]|uniref:hypothetical protein n=1 Tax=Methylocystis sp. IM4 TaxID=3136560 RepID=UPI00311A5C08